MVKYECVDLKKVNAATVRDHYPLPFTEHVLERVAGHEAYSFLDGFSGYNQVSIDPKDQHKTAFATTWGVFAYRKVTGACMVAHSYSSIGRVYRGM